MSTEQSINTATNGHDHGTSGVRWLAAHKLPDLPAHLAGGLVASQEPDETPIWGEQMPDPDALAAAVDRARRTVALQSTPELTEAKSPADIAADLDAEREVRDLERKRRLNRRKAEVEEAEAEDQHRARLARLSRAAKEEAAEAQQEAEKIANPWHEVVRVWRARKWLPLLGTVPAAFSLVAGAVNVGVQLDRIFPGVPLISWVVDPIISILIVVVGATHLYGSASAGRGREWVAIEAFLFALTGSAAVGLHYVDGPGEDAAGAAWGDVGPLIWLFVPIGLGASMWIVPKVRAKLSDDLVRASLEAERRSSGTNSSEVLPTPSDLHGKNPEEPSSVPARKKQREGVTATLPSPRRKTKEEHRKTLRQLVDAGEVDPTQEGITNAVAKRLGCRWGIADELLAEYRKGGR